MSASAGRVDSLIGQRLGPPGHQYEVLDLLGGGAMGAVFRAQQLNLPRRVAIKVIDPRLVGEPGFVARFHREAQAIASLEHAHILPIYDFGEHEGLLYLVMRLVTGGTLKDRIAQAGRRPWPPDRALRLAEQILPALDHAHRAGVIHRDVKPANILLEEDWAYLADFGIAKRVEGGATGVEATAADLASLTVPGGHPGTIAYMAPEQALGQPLDGRADLYALGIVLYELLTGRLPFDTGTPVQMLFQHAYSPVPPPRAYNPALSTAVEAALLKALAKDREKRFRTGADLARALATAVEPQRATGAAKPRTRRGRTWALALGAAAVVGGGLYLGSGETSPAMFVKHIVATAQAVVGGAATPLSSPLPSETTVPPTVPPTAPAGASPTVDPARVLFADTFDDPAAHPWPASPEPSRYVFQHDAGEYVIRKLDPSAALVAPIEVPGTFGDASVAVDARLSGDTAGRYVSIDCRLVEEATPGREVSGYRLSVEPGQRQFSLVRFDRSRPVTLLDWRRSDAIRGGQERNRLELTCAGGKVAAGVNGVAIASVDDATYRNRDGHIDIGVGVLAPQQGPAELRLDNLMVVQK